MMMVMKTGRSRLGTAVYRTEQENRTTKLIIRGI